MTIKHLTYKQIDFDKYDACINNAYNFRIYALSWYLDIVTNKDWEVLVVEDYKVVMPIPYKRIKKRFFRRMVEQPLFCQQLGVFSELKLTNTHDFIREFEKLPVNTYSFNADNIDILANLFFERSNFELDLNTDYRTIKQNYSKNLKRNIKKGIKSELEIIETISLDDFIYLKKKNSKNKIRNYQLQTLKKLIKTLIDKDFGEFYGVKKEHDIIAITFIIKSKKRLIYLESVSNLSGRKHGAMSFIIDFIISKNTNRAVVFDFEGSTIESIARFFKGFGAKNNSYLAVTSNTPKHS